MKLKKKALYVPYFPLDYYEIVLDAQKYNYNINRNVTYIDIQDMSSTTLKAGYITKNNGCSNNVYKFTINNNILNGKGLALINLK